MRRIPFLVLLFFVPTLVLANGSPINTGEIKRTGNIQMVQKKDIRLLTESLSVYISGDYAHVRVNYGFQNTGKADKVTYGFPIECAPYIGEAYAPKEEALTDFQIEEEKTASPGKRRLPILETKVEKSDPDNEFSPFWKWYIVEIPFAENECKNVYISYRVKSSLEDYVYSKSFRPEFSSRTFSYTLNPAMNWGDGFVKNCQIQVDTSEFGKHNAVVSKISPKGYTVKDGVISWAYENLDLSTADDIEIVYDNSSAEFTRFVNDHRLPQERLVALRASSVLKTDSINRFGYSPENLFDNDLNTAWVEGIPGSGVGEWVEVEFTGGTFLMAIGIVNGYTKKESLYWANNRIRKVRLDIEYGSGYHRPSIPGTIDIELDQKQFNELNMNAQAPFIDWLADFGDGGSVRKIRITILEVMPGEKYDETCVAELYLLSWR